MALKAVSAPLGSPVGGSGTPGTIPVWSSGTTLGDSGLKDDGTSVFTNTRRVGVNTTSTLSTIQLQVGNASALGNYQGAQFGIMLPTGSGSWLELAENSTNGTSFRISKDSTTGVVFNSNGRALGFATSYGLTVAGSQMVLTTAGNVGIGTASPGAKLHVNGNAITASGTTGMTDGFFYIPAAAGAPTGVPTAIAGRVPMYYDTTNNNFYVYNGAWKKVLLA